MTQEIVIKHECEGCGIKVFVPTKDRLVGHVNRGYPDGWEKIRDKNLCTGCAQGWHAIVDAEWNKYLRSMAEKRKNLDEIHE